MLNSRQIVTNQTLDEKSILNISSWILTVRPAVEHLEFKRKIVKILANLGKGWTTMFHYYPHCQVCHHHHHNHWVLKATTNSWEVPKVEIMFFIIIIIIMFFIIFIGFKYIITIIIIIIITIITIITILISEWSKLPRTLERCQTTGTVTSQFESTDGLIIQESSSSI